MKANETNWKIDSEIVSEYMDVCEILITDDDAFGCFRTLREVTRAVTNGVPECVPMFWKQAELLFDVESLIPACQKADLIGGPLLGRTDSGMCMSSETARYALQIGVLIRLFGPLDGLHIVEIGGGYGGEACMLLASFPNLRYTCYDLPLACQVQHRYLTASGADVSRVELKSETADDHYDIAFSCCAFGEFDTETMESYARCVLAKSDKGFVHNSEGRLEPEQLQTLLTNSMGRTVHRISDRHDSNLFPGEGFQFCYWD